MARTTTVTLSINSEDCLTAEDFQILSGIPMTVIYDGTMDETPKNKIERANGFVNGHPERMVLGAIINPLSDEKVVGARVIFTGLPFIHPDEALLTIKTTHQPQMVITRLEAQVVQV